MRSARTKQVVLAQFPDGSWYTLQGVKSIADAKIGDTFTGIHATITWISEGPQFRLAHLSNGYKNIRLEQATIYNISSR